MPSLFEAKACGDARALSVAPMAVGAASKASASDDSMAGVARVALAVAGGMTRDDLPVLLVSARVLNTYLTITPAVSVWKSTASVGLEAVVPVGSLSESALPRSSRWACTPLSGVECDLGRYREPGRRVLPNPTALHGETAPGGVLPSQRRRMLSHVSNEQTTRTRNR